MTDHALHPSAIAAGAALPLTPFARFGRWFYRAMLAHQTRRALTALSDDMLRDVGVTRGEIHFVANALAEASVATWPDERR
jgi:uncharacterized protein YjiS (DUF1127 family)